MVPPYIASLLFYVSALIVCQVCGGIARRSIASRSWLVFINEFVGTVQMCWMAYENGVVLEQYGMTAFYSTIAGGVIAHSLTMHDTYATPCPIFEQTVLQPRSSLRLSEPIIRLGAQLAAAPVAFPLAKLVWRMGLSSSHVGLASAYQCSTDLHVSLVLGVLLEMAACFVCRLVWLIGHRDRNNWSMFLDAAVVPSIVVLGLTTTGMYFNPILAFSLKYGCQGVSMGEHLLVYWLGPTIGWVLASGVYNRLYSIG